MYIFIFIVFLFFILGLFIEFLDNNKPKEGSYYVKENPMSETERIFATYLQVFADKYNFRILPQVQLQSIFKVSNPKDITSFNKIKSKSIDFAIVDSRYNYKFFIELDDYTHNKSNRIQRDAFVNSLFSRYNLKLKRIRVKKDYDLEELENLFKENDKKEDIVSLK